MPLRISDADFISAWRSLGSPAQVGKHFGMPVNKVHARRKSLEKKHGIILPSTDDRTGRGSAEENLPKRGIRRIAEIENGSVVIFNDGHIWPGIYTLAMKKLVLLCRELKPVMVVCNGDIFDGAKISSHPPNGWEDRAAKRPEVTLVADDKFRVKPMSKKQLASLIHHLTGLLASEIDK